LSFILCPLSFLLFTCLPVSFSYLKSHISNLPVFSKHPDGQCHPF
jgi:hypothetical protein